MLGCQIQGVSQLKGGKKKKKKKDAVPRDQLLSASLNFKISWVYTK